jgi:hypothetical protein
VSRARYASAGIAVLLCAAAAMLVWTGTGATAQTATATDHTIVIVHVVHNGHPATGRVTIRDEAGHEASCEVNAEGECELQGLASGRHVVEATGPDGAASGARAVMLPESGKVSLIVQLAAPNAG